MVDSSALSAALQPTTCPSPVRLQRALQPRGAVVCQDQPNLSMSDIVLEQAKQIAELRSTVDNMKRERELYLISPIEAEDDSAEAASSIESDGEKLAGNTAHAEVSTTEVLTEVSTEVSTPQELEESSLVISRGSKIPVYKIFGRLPAGIDASKIESLVQVGTNGARPVAFDRVAAPTRRDPSPSTARRHRRSATRAACQARRSTHDGQLAPLQATTRPRLERAPPVARRSAATAGETRAARFCLKGLTRDAEQAICHVDNLER